MKLNATAPGVGHLRLLLGDVATKSSIWIDPNILEKEWNARYYTSESTLHKTAVGPSLMKLRVLPMDSKRFIDEAITLGSQSGLSSLDPLQRKVFLISEAEVCCDMHGFDSFIKQL
jgi:hypothetical protein